MTEIRNHDVVKVKSTNAIGRIIDIHYALDRYQIKGVSGWQYGIQDIEKLNTEHLITTIESQKEVIEQLVKELVALQKGGPLAKQLMVKLESQKAITELAVKALKEVKQGGYHTHGFYQFIAEYTLEEIKRLTHEN